MPSIFSQPQSCCSIFAFFFEIMSEQGILDDNDNIFELYNEEAICDAMAIVDNLSENIKELKNADQNESQDDHKFETKFQIFNDLFEKIKNELFSPLSHRIDALALIQIQTKKSIENLLAFCFVFFFFFFL